MNEWINQPFNAEDTESRTTLMINGGLVDLEPGLNFKTTVNEYAVFAGYTKYRVFLNGEEILAPSDAPETISALDRVEVVPYDKAG